MLPWRPQTSPTGSSTTLVSLPCPSRSLLPSQLLTLLPFPLTPGEQHRIVARAQALRLALESKDPTIKHTPWSPPLIPATAQPSSSASVPPASHQDPKPENLALLERGEVTPYSALQSACLLLSAMFEKVGVIIINLSFISSSVISDSLPPLQHRRLSTTPTFASESLPTLPPSRRSSGTVS